ncbi:hypothetical protein Saso_36430 [Streptomyces asoensis]|uniref:Uncharacterized protein n=1 Tax=Streptomyces asoensis TaxID=249586 RepID=A0ABQ3S1L2_9ACTN|nr:hypothetical protein GCM10010496_43540 [Streptomyces asoensis]GHI61993.1 hypothetical protein Saso_36430 [Streptomyces asoensis]
MPVPVAPATRPCLFSMGSGIRTGAAGRHAPSHSSAPRSRAGPENAYPAAMSAALVDPAIGSPSFRFTPVHHVFSSVALRLHGCARNVWTGRLSV